MADPGLLVYLLVGGRIGGLFFTVPIFGSKNYPNTVKVGLILFLSILMAQYASIDTQLSITSTLGFLALMVTEIIIGLFIGLLVTLFINFVYMAGNIIDYLIGFSMVSVINPLDETQIPITSNILFIYSTLIFLSLNMHHRIILALVELFRVLPIGRLFDFNISLKYLMVIITDSLSLGVAIAAPFIITILVADFVLGMLSKAMPGMNIFILGMPFKIMVGITVFLFVIPLLFNLFGERISGAFDHIYKFIFEIGL